jgi:hypothetical protein
VGRHRRLARRRGRSGGSTRRNNQANITSAKRTLYHSPIIGYGYLHTAIDDHSRLARSQILANEGKETAADYGARPWPRPGSSTSPSALPA